MKGKNYSIAAACEVTFSDLQKGLQPKLENIKLAFFK